MQVANNEELANYIFWINYKFFWLLRIAIL